MSIDDPMREGIAAGWKVIDASTLDAPRTIEVDVVIVGSGAGGGIAAEIMTTAGLNVALVEEGPLRTTHDFRMREAEAYPQLYQESAARKTRDKAINIMQGRCVGGSTTVNWTSSFRTPPATLAFWRERFGLADYTPEALQPWFEMVERRLGIGPWERAPNANNSLLQKGAQALGIEVGAIRRNVRKCWNLGYCGMGCPTGAKQSMLVTTLPAALGRGATLIHHLRAQRLAMRNDHVEALECTAMETDGVRERTVGVTLRARHFVLAAGAIGTPALLLRSQAPDPRQLAGARTFLHPTVVVAGRFEKPVHGHSGAPQSLYTDHFLTQYPIDGPLGFKLEVPPLHPVLFSTTLQGFGSEHAEAMEAFTRTHAQLALIRDGFHAESRGGRVVLRADRTPLLDYPLNAPILEAARRALLAMAEIQFAAGAQRVHAVHEDCRGYASWAEARAGIEALAMAPLLLRVVSAHVMGGVAMSADPATGLTRPDGGHAHLDNLSIFDGSVFPTSIGANPQLSIYGITARNASNLTTRLTGRAAPPLA
ncbi:MAG: GMC family oxidoreductase [Rhodocyclaceae bacterium]|nr:GMC family oxidoreductase [Rhodocyclaceae bacterium]